MTPVCEKENMIKQIYYRNDFLVVRYDSVFAINILSETNTCVEQTVATLPYT
jgi:ethanolamine utilization cobalamin adenosyltransferase